MGSLLEQLSSLDSLRHAWEAIRRNLVTDESLLHGEAGDIELHLADRLGALSNLLRAGTWVPGPVHCVEMEKSGGGTRMLRIPPVADRIVERSIADALQPIVDPLFTPWSFGYRPGMGVSEALGELAVLRDDGLAWAVRVDIADCFDSIDRVRLLGLVDREIGDSGVVALLGLIINRTQSTGKGEQLSVPFVQGLAQGSPLSPLLANLYLNEMDERLLALGVLHVRFADDITLAARDEHDAQDALRLAAESARAVGLSLGSEKTLITTFEQGFTFLGEDIGPVHPVQELARIRDRDLLQKVLYVQRDGAWIGISTGQFQVREGHDGEVLLRVPVSLVCQMVLVGAVGLSAGARAQALQLGIEVTFLSRRGRWLGRLDSGGSGTAALRRCQYRRSDDDESCLELSRRLVAGKIANQRALLLRYGRRIGLPVVQGAAKAMAQHRRSATAARSINALMGLEGSAAAAYFGAIRYLLPDWTAFAQRNRRPPKDPVNAVLSFGYSLLLGDATAAVSVTGLDVVAGFLHGDQEKRPSLALDVMEEFRPLVVDTLTLELFRRNQLTASDFRVDGQAVYLNQRGRRTVIDAYEERAITVFAHVPSGKKVTYRRAMELQARQVARWVIEPGYNFEAVSWR